MRIPSCSKTSRHSGFRRSALSWIAIGSAGLCLVGGDPGRILEKREAKDTGACGEMSAERVGRADDCTRRDERERPVGDPVVLADALCGRLELLAAREEPPPGDRAESIVADKGRDDDEHRDWDG